MRTSGIVARETAGEIYAVGHFANSPPSTLTAAVLCACPGATFSGKYFVIHRRALIVESAKHRDVALTRNERTNDTDRKKGEEEQDSLTDPGRSRLTSLFPARGFLVDGLHRFLLSHTT